MSGPIAPKDPVQKRQNFYLLREKEIFASKQPDGQGIHYVYLDAGRIECCAKLTGKIEDEDILNRLRTTGGFRELVHGIGVSVIAQDAKEAVRFTFQMYGERDPRAGGTSMSLDVPTDGVESVLELDTVSWSDDDKEPGQLSFAFEKDGILGQASVRLYLNDGFTAPAQEDESTVEFDSDEYSEMISKSLVSMGNNVRLKSAIEKAKEGKEVTLAFIGGSITQGAGATPIHTKCYAYQTYKCFQKEFQTNANVTFVKAGVGGTPSEFGMLRYDRDVTKGETIQPDIVVVEFAVNDEGDETKGECYESLVHKIYTSPSKPAVILLFSVFANDWNLQERLSPVGRTYGLPMVSVKDAVCEQFTKCRNDGGVISKDQFFYDLFHPSNLGHHIMADCLMNLFRKVDTSEMSSECIEASGVRPIFGHPFAEVRSFDRATALENVTVSCGSFDAYETDLQFAEMDGCEVATAQYPMNWYYAGNGDNNPFEMEIECKTLLIIYMDSGDIRYGTAEVWVDDVFAKRIDPQEIGWTHCNAYILLRDKESKKHSIRILMERGNEKKCFTILGFGYCS